MCSLHSASNLLFLRLEFPTTETSAHAPAEFFAFFGRHLLPAFPHAVSPTHVSSPPEASTEEDLAQHKEAYRLPECDSVPSDNCRNEPVPQVLHNGTE